MNNMTFELIIEKQKITVKPVVHLYTVQNYMNQKRFGLCLDLLYESEEKEWLPFCRLTTNFSEWIGLKNAAYVDLNNCPFATQLLDAEFAKDTGFTKKSGFCEYPLWVFEEDFLRRAEGEFERYEKDFQEERKTLEETPGRKEPISRTVYVRLEVDDEKAKESDKGIVEYLENEMGWLIPSGIHMTYARIVDEDDPEDLSALLEDLRNEGRNK